MTVKEMGPAVATRQGFLITGERLLPDEPGWPPYIGDEIPLGASGELKRQIKALNAISRQVRIAVDTYHMFKELARRRAVVDGISQSPAAYGTRVVVGALIRDLVICLGTIFDPDKRALSLERVLAALVCRDNEATFRRFHASWPVPYKTDAALEDLRYRLRRIKKGKLAKAIKRIRDLRSKAIAHLDLEPEFSDGRLKVWEIDYVLAAAAGAVVAANLFATGRSLDASQIAAASRKQVAAFSRALLAGKASS